MKILTAQQARHIDELTSREAGIPSLLLMENASIRLVEYVESLAGDVRDYRVLILVGKGNNGGDGLAAARQLLMRGARPQVCLMSNPNHLSGDALKNYQMAVACGTPIYRAYSQKHPREWPAAWKDFDILLDGMLGTGMSGFASGSFAEAITWVNQEFRGHVLAIDLPSGLEADSGRIPGQVVCADATVTFTAPKLCHVLQPAAESVGKLTVAPIGTPAGFLETEEFQMELLDRNELSPVLAKRPESAHKGDFGRILVLAGSQGKAGAAAMAGMGALRSGAGLVTVATPRSSQELVAAFAPELMTEALEENSNGFFSRGATQKAIALASASDSLVVGPGIGQDPETAEFLQQVLDQTDPPVILDADALNLLASGMTKIPSDSERIIVLTPHPGEMARFVDRSVPDVQSDRVGTALDYAAKQGVFVTLKGSRSVIASPEGRVIINVTGNSGMATGGSGDVLAGMVGSILAQLLLRNRELSDSETCKAVAAAVCWHGLAGDSAAADIGQLPLVATDIIKYLPVALKTLLDVEIYLPGGSRQAHFRDRSKK